MSTKHNPLYSKWRSMRRLCNHAKPRSPYYAALYQGISVYEPWQDFENFSAWALSHGYEEGLMLSRKDKRADFCPENCAFVTRSAFSGMRGCVRHLVDGRTWCTRTNLPDLWDRLHRLSAEPFLLFKAMQEQILSEKVT